MKGAGEDAFVASADGSVAVAEESDEREHEVHTSSSFLDTPRQDDSPAFTH
jgi:hypothetical protein